MHHPLWWKNTKQGVTGKIKEILLLHAPFILVFFVAFNTYGLWITELGFEVAKTTICKGNSSNQSVFSIKFFPTFSGLQEAERLHKRFAENHHGRQDFLQRPTNKNNPTSEGDACFKKFPYLYGYMAIAEDLPKLDSETMKRCLVKSKKDIEAIADAPLNLDWIPGGLSVLRSNRTWKWSIKASYLSGIFCLEKKTTFLFAPVMMQK